MLDTHEVWHLLDAEGLLYNGKVVDLLENTDGSLTIRGPFCYAEHYIVKTPRELATAIDKIHAYTHDLWTHLTASEHVRGAMRTHMREGLSSTPERFLSPAECQELYREGIRRHLRARVWYGQC